MKSCINRTTMKINKCEECIYGDKNEPINKGKCQEWRINNNYQIIKS